MYAHRSSRADVGPCPLPLFPQRKKESNDRISTRLSRAYWPPLLSCYHYYTTTLDSGATLSVSQFHIWKAREELYELLFYMQANLTFPPKNQKYQKLDMKAT